MTAVALLGSLVGTPAAAAGFAAIPNRFRNGSDDVLVRDTVVFTTSNVVGDYAVLGTFKSTAYISPSAKIWFDAFGSGVTLNIGDVNHATGLSSAISIATAGSSDLATGFAAAKMGQPLWQRLGYSSDPGGVIQLRAVIAGATVGNANVNLAWQIAGKDA